MLEQSLHQFQNLRTDKNKKRWSAQTTFRAPHKPFLLLSIMDLVAQGEISSSFIEPTFELAETFAQYWQSVMPLATTGKMAYPFYHMSSEPFWELLPRSGVTLPTGRVISSIKRIRELYLGARLNDDLYALMFNPESRELLRAMLINTYFLPVCHESLVEQGIVNLASYRYSRVLLKGIETSEPEALPNNRVRDQGFRKAIVILYEHRCAICGIRMLTLEGHTAVEAAHIRPWSISKNDLPTNGMALCRLCHWSFDEGLMGVGKSYEVKISSQIKREPNFPGHMLTLSDRTIFKPDKENHWPDQDNLGWHRKEVFRR